MEDHVRRRIRPHDDEVAGDRGTEALGHFGILHQEGNGRGPVVGRALEGQQHLQRLSTFGQHDRLTEVDRVLDGLGRQAGGSQARARHGGQHRARQAASQCALQKTFHQQDPRWEIRASIRFQPLPVEAEWMNGWPRTAGCRRRPNADGRP